MKMINENAVKLGIDFGRVIMEATGDSVQSDTSFLGSSFEDAMRTPASTGAVEAVAKLVDAFDGQAWIVSKCGESVQKKTLAWLTRNDFFGATGLNPDNIRFCRKRNEKAGICLKLGITHFIDDRPDVLFPMWHKVPFLYLFGEQPQGTHCPYATSVANWEITLACILSDLSDPIKID